MARKIYWILLILSTVLIGLMYFVRESVTPDALLVILYVLFMVWIASIIGLIAHTRNPNIKSDLIVYSLSMGVLFVILFFLCVYLIMPLFYPDFHLGLT